MAARVPGPVAASVARSAARAAGATLGKRREVVMRHQRRVAGPGASEADLRRRVRTVFESYGQYWVESFRLPRQTRAAIAEAMTIDGREHLDEAFAGGRGVILAAPHLGGWDFGGAWLAVEGYRPVAVVERLEPPELFEWFAGWRRQLGLDIVPTGPDAGTAVLESLKQGRVVGLVSDRDLFGGGIPVEFFGEWTTLPAGPAMLALRTGAPLLPVAVYYTGRNHHHAVVMPPLAVAREGRLRDDVQRVTQAVSFALESLIAQAPAQWHLMQPNWPSDPGWEHGPVEPPAHKGAA